MRNPAQLLHARAFSGRSAQTCCYGEPRRKHRAEDRKKNRREEGNMRASHLQSGQSVNQRVLVGARFRHSLLSPRPCRRHLPLSKPTLVRRDFGRGVCETCSAYVSTYRYQNGALRKLRLPRQAWFKHPRRILDHIPALPNQARYAGRSIGVRKPRRPM